MFLETLKSVNGFGFGGKSKVVEIIFSTLTIDLRLLAGKAGHWTLPPLYISPIYIYLYLFHLEYFSCWRRNDKSWLDLENKEIPGQDYISTKTIVS